MTMKISTAFWEADKNLIQIRNLDWDGGNQFCARGVLKYYFGADYWGDEYWVGKTKHQRMGQKVRGFERFLSEYPLEDMKGMSITGLNDLCGWSFIDFAIMAEEFEKEVK